MNAEKAREIVANEYAGDSKNREVAKAKGYLAALDGPEVRALVEALRNYRMLLRDAVEGRIAEKALAAFTKSRGERSEEGAG